MARAGKGGCTYEFEADGTDGAKLLEVLGAEALERLQTAFGGRRVWIPKRGVRLRCAVCTLRDRCIRTWHRDGVPVPNIARGLGVSPKTVYRVLRSADADLARGADGPRASDGDYCTAHSRPRHR
ncbi:MAG: hypothetical protein HY079_09160 [Elusimicrobia bacterium]|nr:hypothetical protein [Elusimicrobiota bacterium]